MPKFTLETLDSEKERCQSIDEGQWIKVGMSTSGVAAGAKALFDALVNGIRERGLDIPVRKVGSLGLGYAEPLVEINVEGAPRTLYGCKPMSEFDGNDMAEWLLDSHVIAKQIVKKFALPGLEDLALPVYAPPEEIKKGKDIRQYRIVMRNCGVIDPESIDEYIARDGYQALKACLASKTPEAVIEEIKNSGLRGRGGAGFPTGLKWEIIHDTPAEERFVICNGDEGDPGAYMDRSILEDDPHSVLEGMAIAGFANGASQGFLYIRAEYPLAIERIEKAIRQARRAGCIGKKILGTDFNFDMEIRLGAGAFVCGEETALIKSIEGNRGTPRPRPPYPSQRGLWGCPTSINNVETLANIAPIILRGADWFSQIGTDRSKGTKVFALTGDVKYAGLVEVPIGTTLREIVYNIGGGSAKESRPVKAVQTGGPSGGVIPERFFDTPVGYEHLQRLGSIMGSGGMIVMDERHNMVDIAKFYLQFCVDESCGRCAPCRIGGKQMLCLLEKIYAGEGEPSDLELLQRISMAMQKVSLCALGQTAPNPVLSTLHFFESEYTDLLKKNQAEAAT